MATKVCSKCKAEKSLDEYYKQRHGKMAKCKTCCKLAAKNNRIAKYGIRTRIKNTYKSGELIIESSVLGEFAIRYDEDDEETLKGYSWRAVPLGHCGEYYAVATIPHPDGGYGRPHADGRARKRLATIMMHRFIMNTGVGKVVDHKNGDTLDNRKENLQNCSRIENGQNRGKTKKNTSGFKGVSKMKRKFKLAKPWEARITHNKKQIFLGTFATPEEAAEAYDRKACELWDIVSPERQLNFPERYEEYMEELCLLEN
tara:strand:- start:101 stop:871 length:771 start_codon:yes stop_codon:yes gene_type:complete